MTRIVGAKAPVSGKPLIRILWNSDCQASYAQHLHNLLVIGHDTSTRLDSLLSQISTAALALGMSQKSFTGRSKNKSFYDKRCTELKRAFKACCRKQGSPDQLEREIYQSDTRQCRRQFEAK